VHHKYPEHILIHAQQYLYHLLFTSVKYAILFHTCIYTHTHTHAHTHTYDLASRMTFEKKSQMIRVGVKNEIRARVLRARVRFFFRKSDHRSIYCTQWLQSRLLRNLQIERRQEWDSCDFYVFVWACVCMYMYYKNIDMLIWHALFTGVRKEFLSHVCIYIYTHTHTHAHIHMHYSPVSTMRFCLMYVYICTPTHTCTHAHTHTNYSPGKTHSCTWFLCIRVCVCMFGYVCICTISILICMTRIIHRFQKWDSVSYIYTLTHTYTRIMYRCQKWDSVSFLRQKWGM